MVKYFIPVAFTLLADCGFSQSVRHGNPKKKLIGKHRFGAQFIGDKYGSAEITKENGVSKISGSHIA